MARNYSTFDTKQTRLGQAFMLLFERDANGQPYNGFCVGLVENGLKLVNEEEKLEIEDTGTGGLGIAQEIPISQKPRIEGNLVSLRTDVLSLLLHGTETKVSADTGVMQALTVYLGGGTYLLDHLGVTVSSVTGPGGSPSYALNDDYTVNSEWGSINIVAGGAIDTDADTDPSDSIGIEVNYDHDALTQVGAFTSGQAERWVRLDGVNVANNLNPFTLDVFKVGMAALNEMTLVAKEVMKPSFSLPALLDDQRSSGSPYFDLRFKD